MATEPIKMDTLADIFKALSDETRLKIIALLLEREELCVCDFVGAFGLTQSKVSRHLRYLFNARLIEGRREGPWMNYRLSRHPSQQQRTVLAALGTAISDAQRNDLSNRLDAWLEQKGVPEQKTES
ncbi:MAG: metalloregulator ArsR/SmtB family transcription factor [Actinobacteria bacterium]|nr:metalloregulator ArsR/SmtB family transcription factor [Actinomycetota bacterium]